MAVAVLVGAVPIYAAWDYGGVLGWSQWILSWGLCLLAILALPLAWSMRRIQRYRFVCIPAIAAVVWVAGALQASVPQNAASPMISPGVVHAYAEWIPQVLREEASSSAIAELSEIADLPPTHSLDVSLTHEALVAPALFFVIVLIAAVTFRFKQTVAILLVMTMLTGGFYAFVGIADAVRPTAPGQVEADLLAPEDAGAPFGPFVNRNNAGGFLNLCLAAAVGCWTYAVTWQRKTSNVDARYVLQPEHWWERPIFTLQNYLRNLHPASLTALLMICLIVAGIMISGSRGGTLAAIAGGITSAILTNRASQRLGGSLLLIAAAVGTMGLLGLVGMVDAVSERMQTIWEPATASEGRLDHWQDGLWAAWHYIPGGAGLGTYRFAYLPFQEHSSGSWFKNGDGMPVEWLVEGGLWQLPLIVLAVVLLALELNALGRMHRTPYIRALVAAGWFVLASMCVSQLFDFGINLPATYLTLGLFVGALLGTSDRFAQSSTQSSRSVTKSPQGGRERAGEGSAQHPLRASWAQRLAPRPASAGASIVLGLLLVLAGGGLLTSAIGNAYRRAAAEALAVDGSAPPRPTVEMTTAEHLKVVRSVLDRFDAAVIVPEQLPAEISPDFYRRAAGYRGRRMAYFNTARPAGQAPASVMLDGQSIEPLEIARAHALAALLKSPLSDEAKFRLTQLDFLHPESLSATPELYAHVLELRSQNSTSLLMAARGAIVYPGPAAALPLIRRALSIDPEAATRAWPLLTVNGTPEQSLQGLPENPLVHITVLEKFPKLDGAMRQALEQEAQRLVDSLPLAHRDAEQHALAGRLALLRGDWATAVDALQRSVQADPSDTANRFRLVLALEQTGAWTEALSQIERCRLQDPTRRQYQVKQQQLLTESRGRRT